VRRCADYILYALLLSVVGCSRAEPDFVAIDPLKRSDAWALERADIDCKTQIGTQNWAYRFRLRYRADPAYVSCMQQKGFIRPS
jgi:hypothetical protein